jgi:hypothetical protein
MANKVNISIVLCTDDEQVERGYRRMEVNPRKNKFGFSGSGIPGVDVTDDYRGELRDIQRTRGRSYRFTYGDYIVKVLIGSIDPNVHTIDLPESTCCCCVIS